MTEVTEQPVTDSTPATHAAPEVAAPDDDLLDALPEVEQQADPDDIEEDLDGVKVSGKKGAVEKLKAERLMQADYTRKTQEVAESRKATEARAVEVAQAARIYQDHLSVVAELVSLDKQIEQYSKVDWRALSESDPAKAQSLYFEFQRVKDTRQQELQALAGVQQRHALNEQQSSAKRVEEAAKVLRREVPNWSEARSVELKEYAVKQGIPADSIPDLIVQRPELGKLLHKAAAYDALIARRASVKPAPEAQEAPVTRIQSTRATATKSPDQMSDAEFAVWRRRQIAQRR